MFGVYRTLCGVILSLCFVGTVMEMMLDFLKPHSLSTSNNDGLVKDNMEDKRPNKGEDTDSEQLIQQSRSAGSSMPVLISQKKPSKYRKSHWLVTWAISFMMLVKVP